MQKCRRSTPRGRAELPSGRGRRASGPRCAAARRPGPASTISPVDSTYPRSAIDSAIAAFCSTISTATPDCVDLLDDLEVLLDERGRQAHRRLVHQQQPRPRHQRPADRDHLLLTARQRAGELAAPLEQAREQRVQPVEVIVELCAAPQHGAKLKVLPHGHVPEQPAVLRHDGDAARRSARGTGQLVTSSPSSSTRPERGCTMPEDRLQRGRLAGRVAAEQADQLALPPPAVRCPPGSASARSRW